MIGDDVAAALPEMQAQAESLMTLSLRAYSPDGYTPGPKGLEVPKFKDEGPTPGKVQSPSREGGDTPVRMVRVGTVDLPVLEGGLHIPLGSKIPDERWEYVVEAVGRGASPSLLGNRYYVDGVPDKSNATARRLNVAQIPPRP